METTIFENQNVKGVDHLSIANSIYFKALKNKDFFSLSSIFKENNLKNTFYHNFKQVLRIKDMVEFMDNNPSNKGCFVKFKYTILSVEPIITALKLAHRQRDAVSLENLIRFYSELPEDKAVNSRILNLSSDNQKYFRSLFNFGLISKKGNDFYICSKKNYSLISRILGQDYLPDPDEFQSTTESKILSILLKFSKYSYGTRQNFCKYLKEKKCPYSIRISKYLLDNKFVIIKGEYVFWNKRILEFPNIKFVSRMLSEVKRKMKSQRLKNKKIENSNIEFSNDEKCFTLKDTIKNNVFSLFIDIFKESNQELKKKSLDILKKSNLLEEFKDFYVTNTLLSNE